jgi:hypothetical protein
MKSKPTKGRPTKQLPSGKPESKKVILPKLNDKKTQDMLTGRKAVPGMKKKFKTGEELKEAIRKKTGKYPNTAQ